MDDRANGQRSLRDVTGVGAVREDVDDSGSAHQPMLACPAALAPALIAQPGHQQVGAEVCHPDTITQANVSVYSFTSK